jgi:OFA family oxalate/formate antiporter-like MFS transporter
VDQIYAWLFSANIPAALAPIAAGFIYDLTGGFTISRLSIGALLLIATCLVSMNVKNINGE